MLSFSTIQPSIFIQQPINDVRFTGAFIVRAAVGAAYQVHQGTRHRTLKVQPWLNTTFASLVMMLTLPEPGLFFVL